MIFIGLMALLSTSLKAQYKTITIQKSEVPSLKIIQIDNRELSTLVHFQYTSEKPGWISINEDTYIKDKSSFKKYKLLNSINMPFGKNAHIVDVASQIHNYTLEFEKIPDGLGEFDIFEKAEKGFNFYGVKIDWKDKSVNFLDIESFIEETPVKEFGHYFKDGSPVFYYKYKGVYMAVMLSYDNKYGQYLKANVLIKNLSGKSLEFNPNKITAKFQKKEEVSDAEIISFNDYMRKVQNRQAWSNLSVALNETMAASQAGYSASATSTRSSGYKTSAASASGYVGNTYGSVYGSSTTYGSTYGTSYSKSYDGSAAYSARQNASNNIANYQNQQYQIKNTLSEGYLKLNTVPNETEYIGYINIKYKKVDNLQIIIPFFENNFTYNWRFK